MLARILCFALLCFATAADGALVLTGSGSWNESFDTYRGTTASIPAGWVTQGDVTERGGVVSDGNSQNGVLTDGSSFYPAINGWYAMNSTGAPNDYAFGLRTQTSSTSSLTAEFLNSTGKELTGFNIDWDFEQYTEGFGNGKVSVLWSLDGTNFTATGLTGDVSHLGVTGAAPPVVYTTPTVTSLSTVLTQNVAVGDSIFVRFLWTSEKAGNQPHFGIDNFSLNSITAVPEPSSLILLGGGSVAFLKRRRWNSNR